MQITIGGHKQISSASLLVPPKEDAWIEFQADDWNVRIHIIFEDDQKNKDSVFSFAPYEDHAVLTVKNWNSALPIAILQPFLLGETNGKKVYFVFTGYAVEGFKRIDISFFWEVPNDK